MTDLHEQLSGGVAATDGSDMPTVRIAPLPEGERTSGQSGKETVWDADPMREAVESGALDGTTIVKGEGGSNPHFPLDEQVPPENILGRVESWSYEPGVGPVGEADVVDEQMAKRIDAGLLEVSADLERHLGEYDEERDAYPVDSVVSMPRVTVLERGAASNATIETAEALGVNPSGDNRFEQLASTHTPDYDDTSAEGEWSMPNLEDFDTDDLSEVADHFLATTADSFDDVDEYGELKLPVVSPSGTLYLDALESAHTLAGQTDGLSDEDVSSVRSTAERLSDEAFDESLTEEQNSDESAESDTGTDATADDSTEPMTDEDDDVTKEQLREQLAAAKAEKNQLETERDALETEKESLEEETEELESEVEAKEETIDEMEEELDEAQSEAEFSRRQAALIATGGNDAAAETLVESDRSADDLAEMALDSDHGPEVLPSTEEDEDDEQLSPMDKLNEQLAQSPAEKGTSPDGEDTTTEQLSDDEYAAADDRARSVMDGEQIMEATQNNMDGVEYLAEFEDVDATKYSTADSLRSAVAEDGE